MAGIGVGAHVKVGAKKGVVRLASGELHRVRFEATPAGLPGGVVAIERGGRCSFVARSFVRNRGESVGFNKLTLTAYLTLTAGGGSLTTFTARLTGCTFVPSSKRPPLFVRGGHWRFLLCP